MIVTLSPDDLFRLRGARGTRLEALEGILWVTERGREDDACLPAGGRYEIQGDGLVLVGIEAGGTRGRFAVRPAGALAECRGARAVVARFLRLPGYQL